ncbi:MAG: hypothetical protein AB1656_00100 [Candidatus Omnitrophota bacterium]
MKPFLIFLFAIVLLILTGWVLLNFVFLSEEERIERVIEKGRRSVENGSIFSLRNLFTEDYSDSSGQSLDEIMGSAQCMFSDTANRKIHIAGSSIRASGDKAEAEVRYVFHCQSKNSFIDHYLSANNSDVRTVRIVFVKNSRRWKICHTDHM